MRALHRVRTIFVQPQRRFFLYHVIFRIRLLFQCKLRIITVHYYVLLCRYINRKIRKFFKRQHSIYQASLSNKIIDLSEKYNIILDRCIIFLLD